jgi:predicted nucleic acid-binding protein
VWAEVTAAFPSEAAAAEALTRLGVRFAGIEESAALAAGTAWAAYRRAGGARSRVIADFLIGAHADAAADRLLTRDRGFYRRYFEDLKVLDPSAA